MKRIVDSTLIFLIAIVAAISVTVVILYFQLRTDQVSTMRDSQDVLRMVIVLHDDGEPVLTAVLFIESDSARIAILDVPENIGTVIPGESKIDSISTMFDPDDPESYQMMVSSLIGQEVPWYLVFSLEQMQEFIDLIGGVELFVINDYRETGADDPILLPSGNVVLDGPKAIAFLTATTVAEREIERIGRKQSFIHALIRAIQNENSFLNHPEVVPFRQDSVATNLDRRSFSSMIDLLSGGDVDQIIRRRVQGTLRRVDVGGTSKELLFPHFEGQWLQQSVRQIEEALVEDVVITDEAAVIRIEILNGTAIAGFARRTSELFEEYGFEVRRFGNADSDDVEHTIIIDRRGYPGYAARVAGVIRARNIVSDFDADGDVDVSIILGKDFDGTVVRTE